MKCLPRKSWQLGSGTIATWGRHGWTVRALLFHPVRKAESDEGFMKMDQTAIGCCLGTRRYEATLKISSGSQVYTLKETRSDRRESRYESLPTPSKADPDSGWWFRRRLHGPSIGEALQTPAGYRDRLGQPGQFPADDAVII